MLKQDRALDCMPGTRVFTLGKGQSLAFWEIFSDNKRPMFLVVLQKNLIEVVVLCDGCHIMMPMASVMIRDVGLQVTSV
ncbi:hypothetical protein ACFSQU_00570 [Massilia sp. GCM10020059]|uniref:Uncharacterized protein n=1 Tax=Massilia agrisoli TaxID=2892444 RepID=A0ABS8IY58_9BURK|nr:hypothetical protein [Massilia agrisoli]MCC6073469.1 hypothetical protein [Massilia agrisoli]